MEPFSVFLGDPFLSVVLVDGPTVLGEIVWNLDDGQFAIEACCALQAYAVDNSQQDRVVSRDVFVGIPVGALGDVGCQDLVRVLSLVGQVETPEAAVHHDPAGHGVDGLARPDDGGGLARWKRNPFLFPGVVVGTRLRLVIGLEFLAVIRIGMII